MFCRINHFSPPLDSTESFRITGVASGPTPRGDVRVPAISPDGSAREFTATARIDTPEELIAFKHGESFTTVRRNGGRRRER